MAGLKNPRLNEVLFAIRCEADELLLITKESVDLLCTEDFIGFIETLQIITKAEGIKSLIWNLTQEELWHWFLMKREAKLAIRGISVKSRQQGISSFWTSIAFADAFMRANRFAFMASHESPSTHSIFGKARTFQQHLPKALKAKRPLERFTRFEIKYAPPHNSQFTCATANNQSLASGTTIHALHLSEVAKWKNPPANDAITSVLGCVPDHYDTWIFWESTAYGAHDLFHHWWNAAVVGPSSSKWNGYDAKFLSPRGFPEYFFYFPTDTNIPTGAIVVERPEFTDDELAFQQQWNICDNQMAWFVDKLRNKYRGDWAETNQELPWDASLAFKWSGHSWWNPNALTLMKQDICEPIARGRLVWDNDIDPSVHWEEVENGLILIWEFPEDDVFYVLATDTGGGVGGDYSLTWILRPAVNIGEQHRCIAKIKSNRIGAHGIGVESWKLGYFYNRAFAVVEKQNQGILTLDTLTSGGGIPQMSIGYPHLYHHVTVDRATKQKTLRVGFSTGNHTIKELMLGNFQRIGNEGSIWIPSAETLLEMEGFSFDPQKNDWVQESVDEKTRLGHDDEIMTIAMALQGIVQGRDNAALSRIKDDG